MGKEEKPWKLSIESNGVGEKWKWKWKRGVCNIIFVEKEKGEEVGKSAQKRRSKQSGPQPAARSQQPAATRTVKATLGGQWRFGLQVGGAHIITIIYM